MSNVLTFLRESSATLRDVPDDVLTEFAADTMPQLADLDEEFAAEVKRVRPPPSLSPVIGMPAPREEMPAPPQLVPTGTGGQIPVIPMEAQKELAGEALQETRRQVEAPVVEVMPPQPTKLFGTGTVAGLQALSYDLQKGLLDFALSPKGVVTAAAGPAGA